MRNLRSVRKSWYFDLRTSKLDMFNICDNPVKYFERLIQKRNSKLIERGRAEILLIMKES